MHRARPRQLGIAQCLLGVGPETDFVTAELVADAQIAEARQPGMSEELAAQLEPAVLTLGKPLQRARLQ